LSSPPRRWRVNASPRSPPPATPRSPSLPMAGCLSGATLATVSWGTEPPPSAPPLLQWLRGRWPPRWSLPSPGLRDPGGEEGAHWSVASLLLCSNDTSTHPLPRRPPAALAGAHGRRPQPRAR
jgi:hypothetical protein